MQLNVDEWKIKRKGYNLSQKDMNTKCRFSEKIYGLLERGKMPITEEHCEAVRAVFEEYGDVVIVEKVKVANSVLRKAKVVVEEVFEEIEILPHIIFMDEMWIGNLTQLNLLKSVIKQRLGRKILIQEVAAVKELMKGKRLSQMLLAVDEATRSNKQ